MSSTFHLRLTRSNVLTVLPLTTRDRPYLLHRIRLDAPGGRTSFVITEQLRSISADRLTGSHPSFHLTSAQIAQVRDVLSRMLDT